MQRAAIEGVYRHMSDGDDPTVEPFIGLVAQRPGCEIEDRAEIRLRQSLDAGQLFYSLTFF
jgi:hypothetical protein